MEYNWILKEIENTRLDSKFYRREYINVVRQIESCGIPFETAGMVADTITQGPNPSFSITGTIPCLKTRNIYDDYITFSGCNYVEEIEFKKHKKFTLKRNDILITIQGEGSIGKVNIYNSDTLAIFNRPIGLLRITRDDIDPFYVSVFLRSRIGKLLLERGISGTSGQKVLTTSYLQSLPIPLPDLEIQKNISAKIQKAEQLRKEAITLKEEAHDILKKKVLIEIEDFVPSKNKSYEM